MSARKPNDRQPQDKMLARLLADASLPASGAPSVADGANCPDAEMMAAYVDRNLTTEEVAHLETHFADCARCQKILVGLAVSTEELPALEAAPALSPIYISRVAALPVPKTRWRQLAPALGIAATVALWFAMQPTPPLQTFTSQLSANQPPVAQTTKQSAEQPAQPSLAQTEARNDAEIAENLVPSPPAPPVETLSTPRAEAAPALASPQQSQQRAADASQNAAPKIESAAKSPSPETSAATSGAAPGTGSASSLGKAEPQQSLQAEQSPAGPLGGGGGANTLSAQAQTVSPTFAPNAAPAADQARAAQAGGANGISGFAARPRALAKAAVQLPIFASPDRKVLWRIGAGGSIERSTDQGNTWQPQASGVTSDLVAGAAPSNDTAWIVGRAGVILRTTDGVRWQRVTAPPSSAAAETASNVALDFTAVEARDALHATVTAAGGRRFTTSDGGQTWMQQ